MNRTRDLAVLTAIASHALAVQFPDCQTVTVEFAEPIPPGTTVSLGLRPRQNPRWGST